MAWIFARHGGALSALVLTALLIVAACGDGAGSRTAMSTVTPGRSPEIEIASPSSGGGTDNVYLMDADGSDLTRISTGGGHSPAWSPDGDKILFLSDRDGNSDIYLTDSNGSKPENISDGPADESEAVWSPDGDRIAFVSDRDGPPQVYIMDTDGLNPANASKYPAAGADTGRQGRGDRSPAWSPDGTRIAFVSDRDGSDDIYVTGADGSGLSRLTKRGGNMPSWSPDGARIAFVSSRDGNLEVYVMGADGSGQSRLTVIPGRDRFPVWSPDSTRIAFESESFTLEGTTTSDIREVNADDSRITLLTDSSARAFAPGWSPDGATIAFTSSGEVYVTDANHSNPIGITSEGGKFGDWSPDSTRIAFVSDRP